MEDKFLEKIRNIDWAKYLESKYFDSTKMSYKPDQVIRTLVHLSQYVEDESKPKSNRGMASEVIFAIGNDHRGTYYPAALEAIDFIIEIEKFSDSEDARKCAYAVLNDLYYFQLEMNNNDEKLYAEIESKIRQKLIPYLDEES